MELNDDQMTAFKEYAALFYAPADIAYMIGIEFAQMQTFIQKCNSEGDSFYIIYKTEFLKSEAQIRSATFTSAKSGNPQAADAALNYLNALIFDNGGK